MRGAERSASVEKTKRRWIGWTSLLRIEEYSDVLFFVRKGVQLREAEYALIKGNLFEANQHHIAATGRQPESYEARYNLNISEGNSHAFDIHGRPEQNWGAGVYVHIHHNTFFNTDQDAFCVRGVPSNKAEIHHNRFYPGDLDGAGCNYNFLVSGFWDAYDVYGPYRVYVFDNAYGANGDIDPGIGGEAFTGIQELPFLPAPWMDESNPMLTVVHGSGSSRYPEGTLVYVVAEDPPEGEFSQ